MQQHAAPFPDAAARPAAGRFQSIPRVPRAMEAGTA